jgi:hypothetical protein
MPRFWVGVALVGFILAVQVLNMMTGRPRESLVELLLG